MWIVAVAWMYVTVMMAVAHAVSPDGSLAGAVGILLFYGVFPMALVMYLLTAPQRRKAIRAREAAERQAQASPGTQPDEGGLPPGDPLTPEREKPPGV